MANELLQAAVKANENGKVDVAMFNRTAHPESFLIRGVNPEVVITLDGNTQYATTMRLPAKPSGVRVYAGDFSTVDPEELASMPVEF